MNVRYFFSTHELENLLLCDVYGLEHASANKHILPFCFGALTPSRPSRPGSHPFKASRIGGASTSVQQPLHPVFEFAQVAVTFPGVLS